ncbi:peptidoglycan D,D-transpeptidase FtsI family protein [Jiangella gansuensis]|uniref:peptidoglycan D,D-transpeptidase FtsI family protein n=1 Tax=Jiangella gansuensis TaxID=281473 RepID=UPI000479D10D|nr:penicillin-binding protein 2 [Jiangella gansuensis]
MNSPIRRISAGCLLLCVALLINVTYVQAFWADELNARSENRRVLLDEYSRERGPILLADDTPIAQSVPSDDEYQFLRQYPQGPMYAPLTGYYSYFYGRTALERAQNDILSGDDDRLFVRRLIDLVTGEEPRGGAVRLTIDPAAQQAAYEGLEGYKGAVVAIDVETGAILAAVSTPSYGPNAMASHSIEEQQATREALEADPDKPDLNRAFAQRLPPGSVFKLVTAAAALESGDFAADTEVPGPAEYDVPLSTNVLRNQNQQACADGTPTLTEALRVSCNTAFAYLGNEVGEDALREQAERFGFGTQPLTNDDMNAATSVFPSELDEALTSYASIGQYDVSATPLQMAMVSAAIANGGVLMEPYLVHSVRGPDLVSPIAQTEPEERTRAVSPETAEQLTEMMVDVVENGTGENAQIDGIQVAGKTGTAQTGREEDPPYAWFTSFAPADEPRVAVAVVIEEAPDTARDDIGGGRLAAPIARDVMEAVLGS